MVNQPDRQIDAQIDNRHDSSAAINYKSDSSSPPKSRIGSKFRFDDLIVSLADAHENCRARQVTEWEKMRQHNFPLSV